MDKLDRLVWAGSSTFRVGEWDLGVRCTRADIHALLRRALRDHLVESDEDPAPPNFSLHVADAGSRRTKDFHLLYRGVTNVVRTTDLRRVLDALLSYLSCAAEQPDDGSLRFDVVALVKNGVAVLAPAEIRTAMPSLDRRLRSRGLRMVDRPWVRVDPFRSELIVTRPELSVDWAVLEELGADGDTRSDDPIAPGRYPVVGWGFAVGHGESGPIPRALAVTLAASRLLDRAGIAPEHALEGLASLMSGLDPMALWADRTEDLVGPLAALAE